MTLLPVGNIDILLQNTRLRTLSLKTFYKQGKPMYLHWSTGKFIKQTNM